MNDDWENDMNRLSTKRTISIAVVIALVASLAVFAMPSFEGPKVFSVQRMPPPAANATEGNVTDLGN
jgi:hypothetical protein